jgi:hypothetical protein
MAIREDTTVISKNAVATIIRVVLPTVCTLTVMYLLSGLIYTREATKLLEREFGGFPPPIV